MHFDFSKPLNRQIIQRNENNQAQVWIDGILSMNFLEKLKNKKILSLLDMKMYIWVEQSSNWVLYQKEWFPLIFEPRTLHFFCEITLPAGGWYQLKVEAVYHDKVVCTGKSGVFGIGEVFITAGQSNSANSGTTRLKVDDDHISACNTKGWQKADDPQPIATNTGGSPWPMMANILHQKLQLPIGLISVGVGGSPASSWLPLQGNYMRLWGALKIVGKSGARAILWHQGESDSIAKTSAEKYAEMMKTIITQSQQHGGWSIPWMIATAAYHIEPSAENIAEVIKGQKMTIDNHTVFEGPTTEDLIGPEWRAPDKVHFNEKGLKEHGKRWAEKIEKTFIKRTLS